MLWTFTWWYNSLLFNETGQIIAQRKAEHLHFRFCFWIKYFCNNLKFEFRNGCDFRNRISLFVMSLNVQWKPQLKIFRAPNLFYSSKWLYPVYYWNQKKNWGVMIQKELSTRWNTNELKTEGNEFNTVLSGPCVQRSRLAAVLAFEKRSAWQLKPIRTFDD